MFELLDYACDAILCVRMMQYIYSCLVKEVRGAWSTLWCPLKYQRQQTQCNYCLVFCLVEDEKEKRNVQSIEVFHERNGKLSLQDFVITPYSIMYTIL